MSAFELRIGGERVDAAGEPGVVWIDRGRGMARLGSGSIVLVEGSGREWTVTLRGRRIAVQVLTARELTLTVVERGDAAHSGPLEIKATLPGLIVAVAVAAGDKVEAGAPLVTIEAMKMQNEVRAPRPGRVAGIAVQAGETVSSGALLLRLE